MPEGGHRCRRCGTRLVAGLVASPRRACCLDATGEGAGSNATGEGAGSNATEPSGASGEATREPVVGVYPEHGPVGPEDAVVADPG